MPGAARPRCSAEVPVSGAHRIAAVRLPLALTDRQPHGTCGLFAGKPPNPCTEAWGTAARQTAAEAFQPAAPLAVPARQPDGLDRAESTCSTAPLVGPF